LGWRKLADNDIQAATGDETERGTQTQSRKMSQGKPMSRSLVRSIVVMGVSAALLSNKDILTELKGGGMSGQTKTSKFDCGDIL
jgi:hypothetical protein